MQGQYPGNRGGRPSGDRGFDHAEAASAQLFLCAGCRTQVLICSCCDRGQIYCAVDLLAVADPPQILAPGCLLGVTDEVRPGDVVVMSEFTAAQAGEVGFGAVGAGAVYAVPVLVIDSPHGEAGV